MKLPSPLSSTPLNATEQASLVGLLDALSVYLRCPGDWGYETTLGRFTATVLAVRDAVRRGSVEG